MTTKVAELTLDMATDEITSILKSAGLRDHYSRVLSHSAGPDWPDCVATAVLVRVGGKPAEIAAVIAESLGSSVEISTGQFSVSVFRPKAA